MLSHRFLQKVPFFRLTAALVAGILITDRIGFSLLAFVMFSVIGIACFIADICIRHSNAVFRFRWLFGAGAFSVLLALGMLLAHWRDQKKDFTLYSQAHTYLAKIRSTPKEKPKSWMCEAELLRYTDANGVIPLNKRVIIYLEKDSAFQNLGIGQHLIIHAKFEKPQRQLNPEAFDYAEYLSRKCICASAYVASRNIKILTQQDKNLKYYAEKCRRQLLSIYKQHSIGGEEFAVLAALTLGEKDFISDELQNDYASAGVTHILAVSGLHVGVIYIILVFLLSLWGGKTRHTKIKNIIIILFLFAYAFVTGLSPSVVRSALMFSLVGIGIIFNRRSHIYNTVFLSAFIMLVFNSDYIYDIGFQLSYAAVLSIVTFSPFLIGLVNVKHRITKYFWELFSVSLAAQLGTMPLTMYYFHQFPNFFWISNLIIVPLSGFVIYAALALFAFSSVPFLGAAEAFALNTLTRVMNTTVHTISALPYATTTGIGFGTLQLWLLIAAIGLCFIGCIKRSARCMCISLACITLFFLAGAVETAHISRQKRLIVFYDKNETIIAFQNGHTLNVFTTDIAKAEKTTEPYRTRYHLDIRTTKIDNHNAHFYVYGGEKILLLTDCKEIENDSANSFETDLLIIDSNGEYFTTGMPQRIHASHILCGGTVSRRNIEITRNYCINNGLRFTDLSQSGAFVQNF